MQQRAELARAGLIMMTGVEVEVGVTRRVAMFFPERAERQMGRTAELVAGSSNIAL